MTSDTCGYQMADDSDAVYVALNRADVPGAVGGMPASAHDLLTNMDVA